MQRLNTSPDSWRVTTFMKVLEVLEHSKHLKCKPAQKCFRFDYYFFGIKIEIKIEILIGIFFIQLNWNRRNGCM